jgi:PAS domain S-box-containing protein
MHGMVGVEEPPDSGARRRETYEDLTRKVAQQSAVADLGRLALTGATLEALFDEAVARTAEGLGTELAAILQPDDYGDLTCRASYGWTPEMTLPVPISEDSQIGTTYLKAIPVVVDDLGTDDRFPASKHLVADGLTSAASAVIRGGERPAGVLTAHSRQARTFSDDDVLFLRAMANVVAAAIAREVAEKARHRSDRRLQFLADASHPLTASLDPVRTLNELANLVVRNFADWCIVHFAEGVRLTPVAIAHSDRSKVTEAERVAEQFPLEQDMASVPAEVFRTGQSVLIAEVTDEQLRAAARGADHERQLMEAGLRSAIVVPLTAHRGMLGTITFIWAESGRRYDEADLRLAEELARRAGLAIDNARVHQAELVARDRAERLQIVTSRFAAATTPEGVLDIVLGVGLESSGAQSGLVALVREGRKGAQLEIVAGRGYADEMMQRWRTFPVDGDYPLAEAVRTGEGVYLEDVRSRVERFPELGDVPVDADHALVCLPLVAGKKAVGGLVLSFPETRRFADDERAFLEAVAKQCAQALDRTQLTVTLAHERQEFARRADAARALAFVADGICLVDPDGVIRLWNHAATRATGQSPNDVVGCTIAEALPGWEAVEHEVPTVDAGDEVPQPSTLPFDLPGGERWLYIAGVRFAEGVVYAFRDVTAERHLDSLKSDFIATVSHELRTPLAAIYGAATTLRQRSSLDHSERQQFLAMIEEQAERLAEIVNEILIASRIESGELPVTLGQVDPKTIVNEVVEVAHRAAPDFEFEIFFENDVPPIVADGDRLRQVLANLVENARKYSNGVQKAEIHVRHTDSGVRFVVRDFGIGIPSGDLERIFQKFYRVDAAMSHGVSGTGLGLYIVRELVHRMDGRIRVESVPGEGSSFIVELPVA